MAIDLVIMESEFASPCWEPFDSSIRLHPSGRLQLYSHFGSRLVALFDTEQEGRVLLVRAKLAAARKNLAKVTAENNDFLIDFIGRHVADGVAGLETLDLADEDTVPEITGADARMAASPEGSFLSNLFTGDIAAARIDFNRDWTMAEALPADGPPAPVDIPDARIGHAVFEKFVSDLTSFDDEDQQPIQARMKLPQGGHIVMGFTLIAPQTFRLDVARHDQCST